MSAFIKLSNIFIIFLKVFIQSSLYVVNVALKRTTILLIFP